MSKTLAEVEHHTYYDDPIGYMWSNVLERTDDGVLMNVRYSYSYEDVTPDSDSYCWRWVRNSKPCSSKPWDGSIEEWLSKYRG